MPLVKMHALTRNFAAEPATTVEDEPQPSAAPTEKAVSTTTRLPVHYEIADGATGYTYERIFCPYINDAEVIKIDDPYIRKIYQVDNFTRFCALPIRGRFRRSR